MRKNELLTIKVTEGSGTNGYNIMDISIEEEYEGGCDECFDDEVLYLRRKRKWEVILEQKKKSKFMVGYNHGKLNILPSNYHFPPMNFSQLIVNWLLGSVSENVPPLWTLSSKEVKHISNGTRMMK